MECLCRGLPITLSSRAGRSRRCELHKAKLRRNCVVVIGEKSRSVDIERLGPIDIRNRHRDQLKFEIHDAPPCCATLPIRFYNPCSTCFVRPRRDSLHREPRPPSQGQGSTAMNPRNPDSGQRPMASRLRTTDHGPRTTAHGLRTTDYGPRITDYDSRRPRQCPIPVLTCPNIRRILTGAAMRRFPSVGKSAYY